MLDQQTKRNIDSARQILVGKVPDPKAQVEQITTALVYKFMADMDAESEALGGQASFFAGDFLQYEWTKLIDKRLAGQERLDLYVQAITKMSTNPSLPQLFRDIFKGAFLPYNDPRTLTLFLKEINSFSYEHSENLGDAFEYLLSILGSQGDAGQFRTPRNIIDFIVAAVDPQKNETILDPACGTAGFLISAYKHILAQNEATPLTPAEKMQLMSNLTGYDISPDMVKLALVNMYLHGCRDPKIHEYDTLTSEARWGETFAVILANPPFMTPTGGINPHSKFEVRANRSEVLFVDYIAEHLRPRGRAGIIVPEGIIFQAANAYKELRKRLVEDWGLYAVISLPSGVFQPYSGVKTSVLLLDRALAKKRTDMLFVKVQNDGLSLGAQRQPIDKNDLPAACAVLQQWKRTGEVAPEHSGISHTASKTAIAEGGDYNLTGERYREAVDYSNAKWPMVELGEVCEFIRGVTFSRKDHAKDTEDYVLVATTKASQSDGIHFDDLVKIKLGVIKKEKVFLNYGDILISIANSANLLGRKTFVENLKNECKYSFGAFMGLLRSADKVVPLFLNYLLGTEQYKNFCLSRANTTTNISNLNWSDLSKFKIPLPPLEVQEQIAAEIDGYQKVIDGAKQVIANWKPRIKIDPDWPMVELGGIGRICMCKRIFKNQTTNSGEIPFYKIGTFGGNPDSYIDKKIFEEYSKEYHYPKKGAILLSTSGTIGKTVIFDGKPAYFQDSNIVWIDNDESIITNRYLYYVYQSICWITSKGGTIERLYNKLIEKTEIPLPPPEVQEQIVAKIEAEQKAVDECKTLATNMEREISDKISEVWQITE